MYRFVIKTCLVCLAALAVACEKSPCDKCGTAQEEKASESRVKVSVKAPAVATKSQTEDEAAIGNCLLYVFDSSTGELVYSFQDEDGTFDFTAEAGSYDFVAMANVPDSHPLSRAMLAQTPLLLASDSPGHFQMHGAEDGVRILGSKELSITVSRIVSKVDYEVTLNWAHPEYAGMDFCVKGVYMTNVAGSYLIGGREVADVWYNMMFYTPSSVSNLTFRQESVIMKQSDTLSSESPLYVFPNYAEDCHDVEAWSPRCTRMVLEAVLGGETYYYPVTLPGIDPNTAFEVSLVITGPGMRHPEDCEPVPARTGYSFTVLTLSWEMGEEINTNY